MAFSLTFVCLSWILDTALEQAIFYRSQNMKMEYRQQISNNEKFLTQLSFRFLLI